ncbi:MAG: hypothetical protein ACPHCJ_03925 [Oceanococcaceae bacterium]
MPNPTQPGVMRLADYAQPAALEALLASFDLSLERVEEQTDIPGSFWGDDEAGLVGHQVLARADTPLHSLLHEACHAICMDADRRASLHTDAGGDDAEECAVCYLQIVLAAALPGFGRQRMLADMDAWGYSFRLGSAAAWFEQDAEDARAWLDTAGLSAHPAIAPHLPPPNPSA